MNLIIKQMDLFKSKRKVLVHCISQDCVMGAGIAKTFDKKFPNMRNALLYELSENKIKYPVSIPYCEKDMVVINMITKPRYFNKPTYSEFRKALIEVKYICLMNGYKEIGMPKIGCGLDKLSWKKVEKMIREIFDDTDIDILVCWK